jgi:RecB family exonuclease
LKLVAHASPAVLEAQLLDRIAAVRSRDPWASVLVVVPSRRLAEHVERRLVERFGATLGVLVLHHRSLGLRILEHSGARPRTVVEEPLVRALLARVVREAPAGPVRDFVLEHPGAAAALLNTLTDLREAGIDPAEARVRLEGGDAEIARLYGRWCAAWGEVSARGPAIDDAGAVDEATPLAPAFAARFSAVIHHGAYDLIGARVGLVRALDRGREVTFLLPADPADRSGAFGRAHAAALAGEGEWDALPDRPHAAPRVSWMNAQGARAELRSAMYAALAAVEAGARPHDVAIVARAFPPYAAAMDELIDDGGSIWSSSFQQPVRRDPATAHALRAIETAPDHGARRWAEHADLFETVAAGAGSADPVGTLCASMREVEHQLGDGRTVPFSEARAWLVAQADAATKPAPGAAGGGIRVLDAMQARGLTWSHLALVGMNQGQFPRVAREDPFLADETRRRLREATGRPIPVGAESGDEERLLLAMLLRSAATSIHVSWLRADDDGRPQTPSLALEGIAEFSGRAIDAASIEREAETLPAHPRARLASWAQRPGLLDPDDEALYAALTAESAAAGEALRERRPDLAPGIALAAATEPFDSRPGAYDGRVGPQPARATIGATALERLGRCPLQFFFRELLRIDPPREAPGPLTVDARTAGERVHFTLLKVYAEILAEGAFRAGDVDARIRRATEILRSAWIESVAVFPAPHGHDLPILDRAESALWVRALDAFLDADLRRMERESLVPEALESDTQAPIPGGPAGLTVRARFDRVLAGPDGRVIGDYKTGRDLEKRTNVSAMLSGRELQVAIYVLMTGHPVELLGVGPRRDAEPAGFYGFKSDDEKNGVLETLRVVSALADRGLFPIRPGDHCRSCDYRRACRRGHPPTEFREEQAPDIRDARSCWSKTREAAS